MERHVIDFMGKVAGFKNSDGLFAPGGSMANCYSILLARQQMFPDIKTKGTGGRKLVCFVSDQSHYSFSKMAILLGHGTESVIKVKTNEVGRMIPEELEKAIEKAKADGTVPFLVAATTGTTVFGAFDQLEPLTAIARKHKLWMHADGALGGGWLFSSKHRSLLKGIESVDSLTWDLHKLSSLPIYCSMILVNDKKDCFTQALSLNAAYLFQAEKYYDKEYDAGDDSIQCTRKVEAFKLFLYLKAHGTKRLEKLVDNVFELARYFEDSIRNRPNWRLLFPCSESNNICFFFIPDAHLHQSTEQITPEQHSKLVNELKRRMLESGTMMIAYQTIPEKRIPACFRLTISALPQYTKEDIDFVIRNFELLGKNIKLA